MGLLFKRVSEIGPRSQYPADAGLVEAARKILDTRPVVFEITNVAHYMHEDSGRKRDSWTIDDFPLIGPPFATYWMEWRTTVAWPGLPNRRLAVLIGAVTPNARSISVEGQRVEFGEAFGGNDGWMMSVVAFGEDAKRPVGPLAGWWLRIDGTGSIIDMVPEGDESIMPIDEQTLPRMAEAGVALGVPHLHHDNDDAPREFDDTNQARRERLRRWSKMSRDELVAERAQMDADLKEIDAELVVLIAKRDEAHDDHAKLLAGFYRQEVLYPVLMAHSLLACKNVEREQHVVHDHRRKGKPGPPGVKYYTLDVDPSRRRRAARRDDDQGGEVDGIDLGDGQRAMHIARGHFKTYTAERPLLGRAVGTYWWSPHLRGNAKRGVVVKDYAVETSDE